MKQERDKHSDEQTNAQAVQPMGDTPAPGSTDEEVVSVWNAGGFGSWFRRRRFDGYHQYETLEPGGKTKLHHVYTGYYYTCTQDKATRKRMRAAYLVADLLSLGLLLASILQVTAANRQLCSLSGFVGLAGQAWYLYALLQDCVVPEKRTIGDYRASSLGLQRSALVAAVAAGVTALITLSFLLFVQHEKILLQLLCLAGQLAAGGLMTLAWLAEKRVKYEKTRSELAGKYNM